MYLPVDIRTDTGMDRVLHDSCDKYERNGKCPGCLHISEQIVKNTCMKTTNSDTHYEFFIDRKKSVDISGQ